MNPVTEISQLPDGWTQQYLERFKRLFPDEDSCLNLLAELKWKDGYVCTKCGNTNSCRGKTLFSRRCTRCKKEESATANTVFHHCRIPIHKAFEMAYLVCALPAVSSYEISRQFDMRHMTCYNFKKKILHCKESGKVDELFARMILEVNRRLEEDSGNT
jgi:hypothetical protein